MDKRSLIGTVIEKYRITDMLSEKGGMADVYKGEHILLGRLAAIKILKTNLTRADSEAKFKQEAVTIARLEHPNIVHVLDSGIMEDGRPYIAMEYCEGDIATLVKGRVLTLTEVLEFAVPVAQALAYSHQQKPAIVHRDVKPTNVLFLQR